MPQLHTSREHYSCFLLITSPGATDYNVNGAPWSWVPPGPPSGSGCSVQPSCTGGPLREALVSAEQSPSWQSWAGAD